MRCEACGYPLQGLETSDHCPECGRGEEVHSLLPPLVRLLSPRTDGKSDRYQETIF